MTALSVIVIVIVLLLAMTSEGRTIDAATQRFMLYYAGVFALIALSASVGVGLAATDRIVMTPGHRVMAQAVHRAVSFGAITFLIIHIVTEILAQRVHIIDGFVPFLSPFRRFYIGLGTLAGDLIVLLVVTSILRNRFTTQHRAWQWRAIHYAAYIAFVTGILHGLLGGRPGKPYVDWSYGVAIALTAFGLLVRIIATSLRPKETVGSVPAGRSAGSSTSPLHAAALSLTQAQMGGTVQLLPAGVGAYGGAGAYGGTAALGAPPYGDAAGYGGPGYGDAAFGAQPALASLPAPLYEPGYVGPPRYQGAPRPAAALPAAPQPTASFSAAPVSPAPLSAPPYGPADSGAFTRPVAGPYTRRDTGPMPRVNTGPIPRANTGPIPRANTGPMPRANTGPMPRANTGPMPRANTGPMPRANTGPMPRVNTGPMPRANTGPMPRADSGPDRRPLADIPPRYANAPLPQIGAGPGWDGSGSNSPANPGWGNPGPGNPGPDWDDYGPPPGPRNGDPRPRGRNPYDDWPRPGGDQQWR